MGRRHHPGRAQAAAIFGCLLGVAAVAIADPSFLLVSAPGCALLVALALGIFPGEDLIQELRSRRSAAPVRRRPTFVARPRTTWIVRRAGRAFAFALAMRPPPAPARG